MRVRPWVFVGAGLAILIAGIALYAYIRGPLQPGYQVIPATLVQTVVATGRVISTSRAQIGSEITGVVTARLVREGDKVAAGDVLILLRADDLEARWREAQAALRQLQESRRPQAQARLRQAESQLSQARREAERRRILIRSNAIPRESSEQANQALAAALANAEQARLEAASLAPGATEESMLREQLAAAQAALSKTQIRAQFPGTVLTRNVEPGDLVQPSRVLLEIARDDTIEILVPVDERNLGVLALGQTAICITDAYPDRQFAADIGFIAPTIDPQRGTVDIRLRVSPVPDYLRDDLTVTVNIETGRADHALSVPNDVLTDVRNGQASALVVADGRAERRVLSLGLRGLAMTQVTAGLEAGEWVLAADGVQEGERVRVSTRAGLSPAHNDTTNKEAFMKFN
ncbi:MAG TPA: efflux RND transporter periplasmic adaptor subunit [Candidimonas sp.]|nr:efflux RND transporter periplasmic adaptor subunit [Candidimonas sp.]